MRTLHSRGTVGPVSPSNLFAYPFRIFFLSMALLGVVAIPVWLLEVMALVSLPLALPGIVWHQHEMLFGFLSAAIAGFLLTAVCVWTRTERSHGPRLFLLWLVWLSGRLLLAGGESLPLWLVQGVNLAFLPLVMLDVGWRIWRARQHRQLLIMLVLGLLWTMQAGFALSWDTRFSHGALIMALALISIVGGRITPAFTAGWLRQHGKDPVQIRTFPKLDLAALAVMVALMLSLVLGLTVLSASLAILGAFFMLIRLIGWRGWLARQEPLVWILHLSILWIPVALLLLAGTLLLGWPSSAWAHAAGTGAIGCLILGVTARVSLGHTGRPLQLPGGMVTAFVTIQLAALVRVIAAFGWVPWQAGVGVSSLLWMAAFCIFLWRYAAILASPRPDGLPG